MTHTDTALRALSYTGIRIQTCTSALYLCIWGRNERAGGACSFTLCKRWAALPSFLNKLHLIFSSSTEFSLWLLGSVSKHKVHKKMNTCNLHIGAQTAWLGSYVNGFVFKFGNSSHDPVHPCLMLALLSQRLKYFESRCHSQSSLLPHTSHKDADTSVLHENTDTNMEINNHMTHVSPHGTHWMHIRLMTVEASNGYGGG